jgi:hypothetical protein
MTALQVFSSHSGDIRPHIFMLTFTLLSNMLLSIDTASPVNCMLHAQRSLPSHLKDTSDALSTKQKTDLTCEFFSCRT